MHGKSTELLVVEMSDVKNRTITFLPSSMLPRTAIVNDAEVPSVAVMEVVVNPIVATVQKKYHAYTCSLARIRFIIYSKPGLKLASSSRCILTVIVDDFDNNSLSSVDNWDFSIADRALNFQ